MNEKIHAIARQVTERMKEQGVIVHRYDAYSTNSVYLKFDYGAAYSLRISDHKGKKHLKYRFNIELDLDKPREEKRDGCWMEFYPSTQVKRCISRILEVRECRQAKADNYQALVNWYKWKSADSPGFWEQAREV